jgi:hypothetical protein
MPLMAFRWIIALLSASLYAVSLFQPAYEGYVGTNFLGGSSALNRGIDFLLLPFEQPLFFLCLSWWANPLYLTGVLCFVGKKDNAVIVSGAIEYISVLQYLFVMGAPPFRDYPAPYCWTASLFILWCGAAVAAVRSLNASPLLRGGCLAVLPCLRRPPESAAPP